MVAPGLFIATSVLFAMVAASPVLPPAFRLFPRYIFETIRSNRPQNNRLVVPAEVKQGSMDWFYDSKMKRRKSVKHDFVNKHDNAVDQDDIWGYREEEEEDRNTREQEDDKSIITREMGKRNKERGWEVRLM